MLTWSTGERFHAEVMPCMRKALATEIVSTMIPPYEGREMDNGLPSVWPYQSIRSQIL
jgi:hypothetical protein